MSEFITQTARLVPYAKRPKQAAGFVTAYLYEPLANELGAELGSIYVVIEVLVSGRASEELADLIIETIGDRYYNHPGPDKADLESRFESAVKAVNTELGEHVNRGNAAWIGKLSAVIALQAGGDLHLSHTGSAEAFLYRGKTASRITADDNTRPANPTKTFGLIASGQLEQDDKLLLATPALTHQVSLSRLQDIISHNSPNTALSEITQLLNKSSIERIACLLIEITTPELAALRVRSEAPSDIQLGAPETPIEAAKIAAAPLAHSTAESSKKVAAGLSKSLVRLRRRARSLSLSLAEQLRRLLSSRRGRRSAAFVLLFIVLVIIALIWHNRTGNGNARLFQQYQAAYTNFSSAHKSLANGNTSAAQSLAAQSQQTLTSLAPHETVIDRQLASSAKLFADEPRSFSAFSLQLKDFLQQTAGSQVNPITVANLPPIAQPDFLELAGGNAYIIDSKNAQISIVNLQSGALTASHTNLKSIGDVKAVTLSSNQSGMYIISSAPGVWLYNFQTQSLVKQNIAYDHWPSATAAAAYLNNLYLLSDGSVYKYVKNSTGFSPGINYLTTSAPSKTNPGALAIDGSIYLVVDNHLERYLSGAITTSLAVPPSLSNLTNLNATPEASLITGISSKTNRLGLWSSAADKVNLSTTIQVNGVKTLFDAIYDPNAKVIYATADHRLIRFNTGL